MSHPPTTEQQAILDAFATGDDLVIEAGAGSGKTTTLRLVAEAAPRRRGLYLAYNRAIKDDAARSFPGSVQCKTSHGLAYGPIATRYKHRLGGRRVPAQIAAGILRVTAPVRLADDMAPLAPQQLARIALSTVARFCYSAHDEIREWHVPCLNGIEDQALRAALADAILPYARRAWADLNDPAGQLHFTHDTYLKMYQLSRPRLTFDFLLVDEAQDLNPVVKAIVEDQTDSQVCLVGDRQQAIYGWRGAVDAMANAQGKRLYLTQSFRFGQAVADEANKWLTLLGAELRLRGFDKVTSTVGPLDEAPDAILTRSNAAALSRVMAAVDGGLRTALVGGGGDIRALALAARDLQDGRGTGHPELLAFSSWHDVRDYAEHDSSGSDLKVLVDLVDRWGADTLVRTVDRLVDEHRAQVVISTSHKAKGREWPRVQIATDFREPKTDPETGQAAELDPAEMMLAYVAVTRAQEQLDREGLAWVDRWLPPGWDYRPDPAERIAAVAAVAPAYVQPASELATVVEVAPHCPSCGSEDSAHVCAPPPSWSQDRLCPACETHGPLLDDGLCITCSVSAVRAEVAEVDRLIDASSLGTPAARALRQAATAAGELTGIPAEQAEWEGLVGPAYGSDGESVWLHHAGDPPPSPTPVEPLLVVPHCYRCGTDQCLCDAAIAAAYSARNDVPAGSRPAREAWARARLDRSHSSTQRTTEPART